MSRIVSRLIWVPSTVALIGTVIAFAQKPYTLPAPEAMTAYTTSDKSLTLSRPGNWPTHSTSLHDTNAQVIVEPARGVWFEISSDLKGSLMADMSRAPGAPIDTSSLPPGLASQLPDVKQKTPLEKVHEMEGATLEKLFDGYQEGATKKTQLAGLEALT